MFKSNALASKGISVVIPNYNGEQLLPEILPDLFRALALSFLSFEVIVCDDASTDGSVSFISNHYPSIKLLTNSTNEGFAPTINKGIFAAQYDLVFLMNSDLKPEGDYFKPLLRYFERKDTFGVMGRIIGWDDDNIQDGAKYPSFHGVKIKTTGNYISNNPKPEDSLYSMYLSGANALVDRQKLLQLKGFDEIFAPYYIEDFELSLRAWRVGWTCYYEHFAVCRHQTSTTIKKKSKKKSINRIYYRNKMLLHDIHLPRNKKRTWCFQLIAEAGLRIVTGRFYYIGSIFDFLKRRKETLQAKQELEKLADTTGIFYSVREIAEKILLSVKEKDIRRF